METSADIENKKKQANKVAIKFIVVMLVSYIILSQGHLFMNSVMSEGATYYQPWIAAHLNYIQWLKTALIVCSDAIIKLGGFYTIYNETQLLVVDGPILIVAYSCLGLGVWSFLIAFIIAFPAKMKAKWNLFIYGTLVIFALNVLRIAGLGILLGLYKSHREIADYHHEIFNIVVYLCIFVTIYFWIKRNTLNKTV